MKKNHVHLKYFFLVDMDFWLVLWEVDSLVLGLKFAVFL